MNDIEVFEGKTLSSLLKDIHDNAVKKREGIEGVITQLVGQIKSAEHASLIAPLIKEFYDVGVKNDEQLIKVATIAQKSVAKISANEDGGLGLSDDEREQLIKNALSELNDDKKWVDAKLDELKVS